MIGYWGFPHDRPGLLHYIRGMIHRFPSLCWLRQFLPGFLPVFAAFACLLPPVSVSAVDMAVDAGPATRVGTDMTRVRIGVLSHRGDPMTLQTWTPTARYLSAAIPGYRFEIVPLDFNEVVTAVDDAEVDFVLVNPGIYVDLEVRDRVSRIATLNNRVAGASYNVFAGVVFARAEREDLDRLSDLAGTRLMAVDRTSLGGFQMAWRELNDREIHFEHDDINLSFGGTHDRVVYAVGDGEVDAGTVRSNILERMARKGLIDLDDFRIIGRRIDVRLPLLHSTRLYPEWPFSKVAHTDNELAQRVAIALMEMPDDHPAAGAARCAGWTIPLDYQPVHELLQGLRLPPYQDLGKFTLLDALRKYWLLLLLGLSVLLFMGLMTVWVMRLNRELDQAKRKLEQRHELILASVADGICGVDLAGNTTFVNRAMENILGWSAAELIGRNQHELIHHTHADGRHFGAHDCPIYKTFHDQRARFVGDDIFWRRDGRSIPVEYSCTPLIDPVDGIIGSVVVFRDISARRRAEEDARLHQRELAHVARLSTMGEMASGIAHELNQPLTAITTNSHACLRMLEAGSAPVGQCADVMERIAAQAERAGAVLRQIRSFIRKEAPQRECTSLGSLVGNVFTLFAAEVRRAGVTLQLDLDESVPRVLAQPIQIEQVILNLVRNAVEAMQEVDAADRRLTITAAVVDEAMVELRVRDTGPGIAVEPLEQVFQAFVTTKGDGRGDGLGASRSEGMGLGLAISKGIVEAHQGSLSVVSSPGHGAEFRFTLPVCRGGDGE